MFFPLATEMHRGLPGAGLTVQTDCTAQNIWTGLMTKLI